MVTPSALETMAAWGLLARSALKYSLPPCVQVLNSVGAREVFLSWIFVFMDVPIFWLFLAVGVFFACFFASKWVSLCAESHDDSHKNVLIMVHSPAFGGRGPPLFISQEKKRGYAKSPALPHEKSRGGLFFPFRLRNILSYLLFFGLVFNATLGFPGEGFCSWSSNHNYLSFATWNTRSLSFERFNYCKNLGYDILALTELWHNASKYADGSVRWTYSQPAMNKITGNPLFPNDPAAGVGIMLSERVARKHMAHGSPCNRITWVRLKGVTSNLFVIAVYLPHRARSKPAQADTLEKLMTLLKQVPKNDCIVVLGDLNEQLGSNIHRCTGKWTAGSASPNADKIISLMRMFDLFATNTRFQPKKRKSTATYLACVEGAENSQRHLGRNVCARYKGKKYSGVVTGSSLAGGKPRWHVEFADGFKTKCTEPMLKRWLTPIKKSLVKKQLDYILISNRWASSVSDCKVRWAPSIHRNKVGPADHGLLMCKFKWRVRVVKNPKRTDYSALSIRTRRTPANGGPNSIQDSNPADPVDSPQPANYVEDFDRAFIANLNAIKVEHLTEAEAATATLPTASPETLYDQWTKAAKKAAKDTLPLKAKSKMLARDVSARTKRLFTEKERMSKINNTSQEFKEIQKKIKTSSLQDYVDWVDNNVSQMEAANARGDTGTIYRIVRHISDKPKAPPQNLTTDEDGNLLKSAEDLAATWQRFLKKKFDATVAERHRPPLRPIPPERNPSDRISKAEFDKAVQRLPNNKATGPDGVPAEVFKNSKEASNVLFAIITQIWDEEKVPPAFAEANFKMIFKKEDPNDPSKYRCIGLLNHAFKVLSCILLGRLTKYGDEYLQDWQAGFRKEKGTRDNSMILRTLCDKYLLLGKKIALTFIDYSAAFDSVSHKFIDKALEEAGASNKTRSMFRAIYLAAAAHTTVPAPDGKTVKSDTFQIWRGVIQGDLTSPLFFILALEAILRRHDRVQDKGVKLGNTIVHTLGYADDAALLDDGDEAGICRATERVTNIALGSRAEADMEISIKKTKVLHVRAQDETTPTTTQEAEKACKYTCPHLHCGFKFLTRRGMLVHAGRCEWKDEFEIDGILDCKGDIYCRRYKVRWTGYTADDDM